MLMVGFSNQGFCIYNKFTSSSLASFWSVASLFSPPLIFLATRRLELRVAFFFAFLDFLLVCFFSVAGVFLFISSREHLNVSGKWESSFLNSLAVAMPLSDLKLRIKPSGKNNNCLMHF